MTRATITLTGDSEAAAEPLLAETFTPFSRVVLCQLFRRWEDGEVRTILDCAVMDRDAAQRLQRAIAKEPNDAISDRRKETPDVR